MFIREKKKFSKFYVFFFVFFLPRNFSRKIKKPSNNNSEFNQKEITKRTRYSSSESESRITTLNESNLPQKTIKQSSTVKIIQTPKTSQKDIDKLIQLLKESSSLSSSSSSSSSSYTTTTTTTNNNNITTTTATTASDTNNSSNESNDLISNKNSKRKKLVQNRTPKASDCDINKNSELTLNDFKSLDINSDFDYEISNFLNENSQMTNSTVVSSREERQKLWNSVSKLNIKIVELNFFSFLSLSQTQIIMK